MFVAQASVEQAVVVSNDTALAPYGGSLIW
jgi:hypothetical protein